MVNTVSLKMGFILIHPKIFRVQFTTFPCRTKGSPSCSLIRKNNDKVLIAVMDLLSFCIVFSYGFFVCLFVFHWGEGGKFKLLYSYFWNAVSFYLLSFPVLCVLPSVLHPVSLFMDLLHLPLLPQLFPFSLITLKCIHSPALPFNPLSECLFTFCCVCALCLLWDLCPLVLSA